MAVKTGAKKLKIIKSKLRPLTPGKNYFQSLVRSIIFQQLSGKAAASILKKFVALWPKKKFPTPEDVLTLNDAQFRSAGISAQKAKYLRDLAQKFIDRTINAKKIPHMSDQEIIDHLVQVKGIGEWTAHMFLIFTLNRPDVLPTGDLGIRKGFQIAFNLKKLPDHRKMLKLAAAHKGEHTYLALHLWKLVDDGGEENW